MSIVIGTAESLGVNSSDVQSFYAENWTRKIALSNKQFYEWQFIKLPGNRSMDLCHVAVDNQSDEIVGVMGLNKRPFNLVNRDVKGAELTTWIVHEKHQGTGVGAKILLDIKRNYDVLVGMNISEAAVPIYLRSGFRYIRQIPRFFRIYNPEKVESISEFTPLARKMINLWRVQPDVNFLEYSPQNSELEYIDSRTRCNANNFCRSPEFLAWRYNSHPFFKYESRIIQDSRYLGKKLLVVYRVEETSSSVRVMHVMDLLGDSELIPAAISFVNSVAASREIDLADFYCTLPSLLNDFFTRGWFSASDDYYIKVPNLFQPAELRTPQTSSFVLWGNGSSQEIYDLSRLYITKQDCDLDRPTMHFIEENLRLSQKAQDQFKSS